MALTATANADGTGIELVLDGWAGTAPVLSRVEPDGSRTPVRAANPADVQGGAWSGVDYEPSLDVPVRYSASDGTTVVDAEPVVLASLGLAWLRHLGRPSLSMPVQLTAAPPDLKRPSRSSSYDVIGRAEPIATTLLRSAASLSVSVYTSTLPERLDLLALLADGSVLQLAMPASSGLGRALYVLPGDATERRVSGYAVLPDRLWTLDLDVVARPV